MSDKKSQAECVVCDKFGDRLRQLRKKQGMVQKDFGDSLGVSLATITRLERGVFKPQGDFLAKLAVTYVCDIRWLLTGEGQKVEGVGTVNEDVVRDPHTYNLLKAQRDGLQEIVDIASVNQENEAESVNKLQDKVDYLNALLQIGIDNKND
jgi:transcriptional regulator with XRE-family HTH domain